jgi:hypothetical protein
VLYHLQHMIPENSKLENLHEKGQSVGDHSCTGMPCSIVCDVVQRPSDSLRAGTCSTACCTVAVAVETIIDKAILEDVEFEDDGQKLLFVVPMDVPEKASENSDVCHEYFTNTVKELEDYGVFAEVC